MRAIRISAAAATLLLLGLGSACHSAASLTGTPGPGRALCRARPDSAWKRALAEHVVALSRHASVIPWALAGDRRSFFASLYSKSFSGVVEIDATSGRFQPIKGFASARKDQAVGSFDGRWLVWNEYHSLFGSDDFTTWSWDSSKSLLRQIGRAARSPSGEFWASPTRPPDVRAGFATWTQGSGPGGAAEVHVFDLARGRDRVIRRGHPAGSLLVAGGLVVWPESPRPGALTEMRAASVATGGSVAVPAAFRGLRGVLGLATDGRLLAYPNADYTSLWWSPSLGTTPRRLFTTGNPASHIDNSVQLAGRYVAFGVPPALYLADMTKGRYVELSAGGFARLDARTLVVAKSSESKAIHPIAEIIFLPLASLPPMRACS